jgi:hypothetical protein
MKHAKNRLAAFGMMLGWLAAGSLQAQTAVLVREWPFTSSANPAAPEVTSAIPEEARAVIQQGQFASGWFEHDSMLGSEKGIWDLGRKGILTLSKWSGEAGPATASHEITVRVTQWYDGASTAHSPPWTCRVRGWPTVLRQIWHRGQSATGLRMKRTGRLILVPPRIPWL